MAIFVKSRWRLVHSVIFILSLFSLPYLPAKADTDETEKDNPRTAADRYLNLGTAKGELGGAEQKAFERREITTQIKSFIPPLLPFE